MPTQRQDFEDRKTFFKVSYAFNQKPLYVFFFSIERYLCLLVISPNDPLRDFCVFRSCNSALKLLDFYWKFTIFISSDKTNEYLLLEAHSFQGTQEGSCYLLLTMTGHGGVVRQFNFAEIWEDVK